MTVFLLVLVGLAPGTWLWLRSLNRLRLAKAELQIAKAVTSMERLLLSGDVKLGDCCHDEVFEKMKIVQSRRLYPVPWNSFRQTSESEKSKEFKERLIRELEESECHKGTVLADFVTGYYRAVRAAHPVEAHFYILSCFILAGGASLAIVLIGTLLHWVQAVDRFRVLRQKVKADLVAASCSEVIIQPKPFELAAA